MIGGWRLYIQQREKVMFGNLKGGFLTEERFIIAMIAVIISEHKALAVKTMRLSRLCKTI